MYYNIGEFVMVKPNLERGTYGNNCVVGEMLQYNSKIAKIIEVHQNGYRLNFDGNINWEYKWNNEMVVKLKTNLR